MAHLDFLGAEVAVGDYVYRNEKVHEVLALTKDDEWGGKFMRVTCIHPYTWKKPQKKRCREFVKMTDSQIHLLEFQLLKEGAA